MSPAEMVWFFAGAGLYAAGSALILGGVLAVFLGAFWRRALVVFAAALLVFLALHPFPDPDSLNCPIPGAAPLFWPGHALEVVGRLWSEGVPLRGWLTNLSIVSAVMNVAVCAFAGAALAGQGVERLWLAALFGLCLSLGVELTQLTGMWGIYPCAYRQFDSDDLILNVGGVLIGFALWRAWRGRTLRKSTS